MVPMVKLFDRFLRRLRDRRLLELLLLLPFFFRFFFPLLRDFLRRRPRLRLSLLSRTVTSAAFLAGAGAGGAGGAGTEGAEAALEGGAVAEPVTTAWTVGSSS